MTKSGWLLFLLGQAIILWAALIGTSVSGPLGGSEVAVTNIAGLILGSTLSICGAIFIGFGTALDRFFGSKDELENPIAPIQEGYLTAETEIEVDEMVAFEAKRKLDELRLFGKRD